MLKLKLPKHVPWKVWGASSTKQPSFSESTSQDGLIIFLPVETEHRRFLVHHWLVVTKCVASLHEETTDPPSLVTISEYLVASRPEKRILGFGGSVSSMWTRFGRSCLASLLPSPSSRPRLVEALACSLAWPCLRRATRFASLLMREALMDSCW